MKHLNYIKQSKVKACITIFKALLLSLGFLSLAVNAGPYDPKTEEEMEVLRLQQIQWSYQRLSSSFKSEEWIEIYIGLKHFNSSIDMDTPPDSPQVVLEIETFLGYLPDNSYKNVEYRRPTDSNVRLLLEINRDALDAIYNYPYIDSFGKNKSYYIPAPVPIDDNSLTRKALINQKTMSSVEIKAQDYQSASQQISASGTLAYVIFSIVLPDHITTPEEGTKVVDDIVNQAVKLVELSGQSLTKKPSYHRANYSNVHHKKPVYIHMKIDFGALDYLNQNELVTRIKLPVKTDE